MTKYVIAAIVLSASLASADDKLNMGTDVVKFAKPVTEEQCLAKTKAGIAAAGIKDTVSVPHGLVGKKTDYLVYVDCLQSWGFNAAHVTVASLATKNDEAKAIRAAVVKALNN